MASRGASWAPLGASQGPLGASRGIPGELLARLGALLGRAFFEIKHILDSILVAKRVPRGSHFGSQDGSKIDQKSDSKTKTKKRCSWDALDLPFPPPSALSRLRRRKCHSFFDLSKPHFLHLMFFAFFASSWGPLGLHFGPLWAPKLAPFWPFLALGSLLDTLCLPKRRLSGNSRKTNRIQ